MEEGVRLNFFADVPWKAFGWIGLAAVLYSAVTFDFGNFWDWSNTFVATGLSVIAGVLLYRHQTDRAAKHREDQLLTALAGELGACLGMLRGRPTPILVPTGTETDEEGRSVRSFAPVEEAVLVRLPSVAVQEALRSAVFEYEDSRLLTNIAGHIQVHNSEVSFILSGRVSPITMNVLTAQLQTVKELKQRQGYTAADCVALLAHLRSEGIEIPNEDLTGEAAAVG